MATRPTPTDVYHAYNRLMAASNAMRAGHTGSQQDGRTLRNELVEARDAFLDTLCTYDPALSHAFLGYSAEENLNASPGVNRG